ncbi:MAG TPA: twin-arginine translocase TatA/TatE family subunit [Trueperaceae bacterium]|nr:twin-arginine translocase TatA/TatE family subunit [Trueperaceae bacterium]
MRLGSLGLPELLIILLVVLLIFGPRRLPDMAKGLGQSVREFRKGVKDMKEDFEAEAGGQESKSAPAKQPAAEAPAAEAAPATAEAKGGTPAEPEKKEA